MANDVTISELAQHLQRDLETNGRAEAVRAILAAVDGGLPIEDLYTHMLEPFLESVGRGWQEGRTAVWQEHLIVGAVRTAIDALYPRVLARKAGVDAVNVTVAFFCPPEETHDVGLRMLADRFDLRGFHTVYVGAMTPVDEMVACVRATGATVICLSASTHFQRTALHAVVQRLRERLPEVRIVVGGPAFARSCRDWEEYTVDSVDALMDELAAAAPGRSPGTVSGSPPGAPSGAPGVEDSADA
ncbi:MAG: cobalamin-dependent protein [Thermoleophilia bacterium]|nr:cobalamin-dependent protein [Thermoleophilia bacterium]